MSGFVTVTFPYLESRVQRNERNVQLFQYGYSSWYNITQDIYLNQNEITCRVSSFSYFTIIEILDYISPITEVLLNGSYAQQVNELTNDVLIEIYAYDDFPGTKSFYSLDGITWILYNNPFILSIEGYYHFQVYSIDTSNNSLLPYWYDILIDRLPPITTIVIEPLKVDSSGNLHYFAESTLSFIVNDTSTYYITYFRIENTFYNDWEIYYDPIELPDSGTLRIEYYSIDSVGHEEEIHTITISLENPNIDFLPIIIGSSIAGLAGVVVLFTILFLKKRRHNSLIES